MEVPEAGAGQEQERPEWLPDKFKSPEDMARSYSEAEQRILQLQSEIDRQRDDFNNSLTQIQEMQQAQQPAYDATADPLVRQFQQALDEGDANAVLAIQLELNRQVMRQEMQQALQEFGGRIDQSQAVDREMAITMATERVSRNYEDWEELAPRIGEFLQENPGLIPNDNSIEGFERAINLGAEFVQGRQASQTRQVEDTARLSKLQSQGLSGQGARISTPEEQAAEWDRIKSIPLGGYAELFKPK